MIGTQEVEHTMDNNKEEDFFSYTDAYGTVLNCKQHRLFNTTELIDKFGWEEYFIFSLMLLVSILIGVFFWWKGQNDNAEYMMGGKNMGTFPMTMSLIASFMSAITLLGTPKEMYQFGTQYIFLVLAYPLVMGSAAHFYLPVFWKLQVSTSYEYLEWRFNKPVRILASACFTLQMVLYMSIVVYTPALAMSQVTGIDVDLACAIIFAVCIVYTTIGGIKAVMWTDTFQGIIMFGSFLAVIIKGNYDACGAKVVWDRAYQSGRIEMFNFDTDPTTRHTVWTMIIGGYFTWISVYGINQTQVQRYLTVREKSQAVKAIWWNVLGIGSLLLLCAYAGLVVFAYYDIHGCDPIKMKLVEKPDQIFPLFVMQVMGDIPCIPGLFVAGVFSGALSTVSSGLNALAAVTFQDFIQGGCGLKMSEKKKTIVAKGLAVGYGILAYGIVFLVKYLPGVLEAALGIFGIVGGPVLGAFTLGMFVPWANSIGAFVGCFSSLIFTMWFGFGQTFARNFSKSPSALEYSPILQEWKNTLSALIKPTRTDGCADDWWETINGTKISVFEKPPEEPTTNTFDHLKIYEVSYMWFSAIPCMMCITIGIIVSFISKPQNPKKLNPDLISPMLPKLFSWWPFVGGRIGDWFENGIGLGIEYIPGEKEENLRQNQIMGSTERTSLRPNNPNAAYVEENNGKHASGGQGNQGFQMDRM